MTLVGALSWKNSNALRVALSEEKSAMIKVENLTKRYAGQTGDPGSEFRGRQRRDHGLSRAERRGQEHDDAHPLQLHAADFRPRHVAGFDIFEQSLQARAHLGYMPENVPLYNDMRVTEYLDYRAALKGVPHRRIQSVSAM